MLFGISRVQRYAHVLMMILCYVPTQRWSIMCRFNVGRLCVLPIRPKFCKGTASPKFRIQ